MDILFTIVLAWLSLTYATVSTQTRSYGALMISVGAALTLLTLALTGNERVAWFTLIAGRLLFFGGFAVILTFEGARERERFRNSSWKEIIFGRVPEHLQTHKISEAMLLMQSGLISVLFAVILYVGDRKQEALSFLVIAIVFMAYLGSLGFGGEKGSE